MTESGWISVKERLPAYNNEVIIAFINTTLSKDLFVSTAIYGTDGEWWEDFDSNLSHLTVTHWQPLPAPPPE